MKIAKAGSGRSLMLNGLLALLCLVLLGPFVNKAFHIDEVFYLVFGKYVLHNPTEPFKIRYFSGTHQYEHAYYVTHTPLPAYINALVYKVVPRAGEKTFHVIYLIFYVALVVSFHRIAGHFVQRSFIWTVLLLVSPGLFLSGQSIYPDLAPLSLGLMGFAILFGPGPEQRKWLTYISAAIMFILSWMMAYPLFLLTLISPLIGKIKTGGRFWYLGPALISTASLGLVSCMTLCQMGSLHFMLSLEGSFVVEPDRLIILASLLCNLGGCLLFPLVLLPVLFYLNGAATSGVCALVSAILTVILPRCGLFCSDWLLTPLLLWIGLLLVSYAAQALKNVWTAKRVKVPLTERAGPFFRDLWFDRFSAVWIVLFLGFNLVVVAFGAVRYTIHCTPPLLLVLGNGLERSGLSNKAMNRIIALFLALTLLFSLALSRADYEFADCYRGFFYTPQLQRFKEGPGTIYLVGKFGFRYYGDSQGYAFYGRDSVRLEYGDLIIQPRYCGAPLSALMPPAEFNRLFKLTVIECPGTLPLRLVQYDGNAGFYCSLVGHLPYTISNKPLEEFSVYLVGR
ncbi:hypothetical protein JXQ70_11745 [bacterium]|nr:hypothetical protein [bacterium]